MILLVWEDIFQMLHPQWSSQRHRSSPMLKPPWSFVRLLRALVWFCHIKCWGVFYIVSSAYHTELENTIYSVATVPEMASSLHVGAESSPWPVLLSPFYRWRKAKRRVGTQIWAFVWGDQQSWFAWHVGFFRDAGLSALKRDSPRQNGMVGVLLLLLEPMFSQWTPWGHSSHGKAQRWERIAINLQQAGASPPIHISPPAPIMGRAGSQWATSLLGNPDWAWAKGGPPYI